VIAATATLSGLKLVTLNAHHFPTIPGVVVPYRP
jgi:predicted nucleic acid-binding protein